MATGKGKKGYETEELLRAYFLQAGFYVIRGAVLQYGSTDITDIDLWIYERSATLARRRTIIDVKDKQKPQAAERLLFVSGLAKLIGAEGAGVATTDKNPELRKLARKNKVLWIDGEDLQRLKKSNQLSSVKRLSEEQLFAKIDELDKSRGGKQYRKLMEATKSAVGDRFGISSANVALESFQFVSEHAVKAHPKSASADILVRLAFYIASIVAASLDFASADSALRPTEERRSLLANGIRYGEDSEGTMSKLEWTDMALREYVQNGSTISKQIIERFNAEASSVPAEELARISIKLSNTNLLFDIARSLESIAFQPFSTSFDELPVDAKGFVGALLDFCSLERGLFANAMPRSEKSVDTAKKENTRPLDDDRTQEAAPKTLL